MTALPSHAMLIRRHGGPEVLEWTAMDVPAPGPGEVRIVQHAVGLNFADIYLRKGAHGPHGATAFPVVPGSQGAGIVESVGPGVTGLAAGDAVAYLHPGAYAQARLVPAERVIALPDGLTLETAAGTLLRGMTAEYLLHRLYRVLPGQFVLVHAAAGGMGQILSAWARALGAHVIGTVGSDSKRDIALAHGCHDVINYRTEDFAQAVDRITAGAGVSVVYDAVGRDVFLRSLDCLALRGMAINYGTASGDVEAFDLQRLHAKSLTVCRPTLKSFVGTRPELLASARHYAQAVRGGQVRATVAHRYPLKDAARGHADLEGRRTAGAIVLIP
ncbi:quinone oxidoreductase family protein [Bordetella petrii]|uniref:quinone oxidoreductase family protein n=1 Tax=Bordetella petrii TaxID=94624 RepID=UPI001E2CE317|nr:quinone oxidoreductase [Bordetella petrii]MCD0502822.1 quinone oxidoreductase [Bordetella petrii]